jgi:hypothetical protein
MVTGMMRMISWRKSSAHVEEEMQARALREWQRIESI